MSITSEVVSKVTYKCDKCYAESTITKVHGGPEPCITDQARLEGWGFSAGEAYCCCPSCICAMVEGVGYPIKAHND